MCYGWGCSFENSMGECGKPRYETCPMKDNNEDDVMTITHGHEEYKEDEPIEEFIKRCVYFK